MISLSIVIPTHNGCRYLPTAIRSARAAAEGLTHEIVVVDDGSDDCTEDLVALLADSKDFTFVRHDRNRGKLAALNSASAVIGGDHVVVLDADDALEPAYFERTLDELDRSGADFVYTACALIDEKGVVIGYGRSLPFEPGLIERYSFIPDCALTTAACFRSVIPLDEGVRRLPKHHRWKRICAADHRGSYLAEPLLRYRMHDDNMSGIGRQIRQQLQDGRHDHHLLSGYWEALPECRV